MCLVAGVGFAYFQLLPDTEDASSRRRYNEGIRELRAYLTTHMAQPAQPMSDKVDAERIATAVLAHCYGPHGFDARMVQQVLATVLTARAAMATPKGTA